VCRPTDCARNAVCALQQRSLLQAATSADAVLHPPQRGGLARKLSKTRFEMHPKPASTQVCCSKNMLADKLQIERFAELLTRCFM
jgi:hypothetical protein